MGNQQRLKEAQLEQRLQQRAARQYGMVAPGGDTPHWDIADVGETLLAETISNVLSAGDLISFSRARTGSAVNVTVLSGDQRFKQWAGTINELVDILEGIRKIAQAARDIGISGL
jgi:DNA-binding transcriptional regulator LsrR (DeoR family)